MTYAKLNNQTYAIRLMPGEDILVSLEKFCQEHDIASASVSGLGSVESPTLAHYRKDTKQFTERKFEGIFELASLTGSVSRFEGRPLAHIHVVLGDEQMQGFAGHLSSGVVSALAEIFLTAGNKLDKVQDDDIGLKAWDFGK